MQLTGEQRIFVVTNYLKTKSFKDVLQLFEHCLRDRVSPTKMTFWKNVEKYKTETSSLDLNKYRSCRRRTERTQENINLLQEQVIEDPRISARKNGLEISKNTFNRITKRALKLHPCKMHVRKESIINEVDVMKENQDLLEIIIAGM